MQFRRMWFNKAGLSSFRLAGQTLKLLKHHGATVYFALTLPHNVQIITQICYL